MQLDDNLKLLYFKLFFKHKTPGRDLLERLSNDKNFMLRLQVLKYLALFTSDVQKEFVMTLLQDRSAKIRVAALQASRPFAAQFDDNITLMLSDEAAAVRDLCRFLLKDRLKDFAAIYRQRIQTQTLFTGSISGLVEVGTGYDLPGFQQNVVANKPAVVIACLTGINKFDEDKAVAMAFHLLTHPSAKVNKAAAGVLSKCNDNRIFEHLRRMYAIALPGTRKTILKIYGNIGGWYVPGDFLLALTDEDISIQKLGWQLLEQWLTRVTNLFTTPPQVEMERTIGLYNNLNRGRLYLTYHRENLLKRMKLFLK